MTFLETTYDSPSDLLTKLHDFLVAAGDWAINKFTGTELCIERGDCFMNFGESTDAGGSIRILGSTAFDAGSAWNDQPGRSFDHYYPTLLCPMVGAQCCFWEDGKAVSVCAQRDEHTFRNVLFGNFGDGDYPGLFASYVSSNEGQDYSQHITYCGWSSRDVQSTALRYAGEWKRKGTPTTNSTIQPGICALKHSILTAQGELANSSYNSTFSQPLLMKYQLMYQTSATSITDLGYLESVEFAFTKALNGKQTINYGGRKYLSVKIGSTSSTVMGITILHDIGPAA